MSGKYTDPIQEEDLKRKKILLSVACMVVILTFCIGIALSRLAVGNVDVTEGVEKIQEQDGEDVAKVEELFEKKFKLKWPDLSGWEQDQKETVSRHEKKDLMEMAASSGEMGMASFFFLFLLPVLALYYIVPKNGRNAMFAVLSAWIFAWGRPLHAFVLAAWSIVHYYGGFYLYIAKKRGKHPGRILTGLLVADVGILTLLRIYAKAFLPVCATWFVLGQMSYIIDVYTGRTKAQQSAGTYGAYSFFFPVMTAGPALQYAQMEPQLAGREETLGNFARGIQGMLIGLAKILFLGDSMARIFIETGVAETATVSVTAVDAWLGTLALAFSLYFTLSGLSDIACGLGRMFGFELSDQFAYPYLAGSMREFWQKWNRGLGSWFGTYLYAPLKARLRTMPGRLFALLLTWVLLGCWHGTQLRFLLWGAYMGALLFLESAGTGRLKAKLPKVVQILWQLLLVLAGWVILFAGTPDQILLWFERLVGIGGSGIADMHALYLLKENAVIWLAALIGCTPAVRHIYMAMIQNEEKPHPWINALVFAELFFLCVTWILCGAGQYLQALSL